MSTEPFEGAWESWEELAKASRTDVGKPAMKQFRDVTEKLPCLRRYIAIFEDLREP